MAIKIKKLRELMFMTRSGYSSIELCFSNTHEKANAMPIGDPKVIVWPSVYRPDSVEDNAPQEANAYRFCASPYRTLLMSRNMEEVKIQYYRLLEE